jgi:hypothetical protein
MLSHDKYAFFLIATIPMQINTASYELYCSVSSTTSVSSKFKLVQSGRFIINLDQWLSIFKRKLSYNRNMSLLSYVTTIDLFQDSPLLESLVDGFFMSVSNKSSLHFHLFDTTKPTSSRIKLILATFASLEARCYLTSWTNFDYFFGR